MPERAGRIQIQIVHRRRALLLFGVPAAVCLIAASLVIGRGAPGSPGNGSSTPPVGHAAAAEPSASPGASGSTPATGPSGAGPTPGTGGAHDVPGTFTSLRLTGANRIELYAGAVSIAPGQPLALHVSTRASRYEFQVERLDSTLPGGGQVVATVTSREGHDFRALATIDPQTLEVRANWPVTDTLATNAWTPGVYIVTARDSDATIGRAIFVVRTPVIAAGRPLFVWSALTYQAYNLWGGSNLYSYAGPEAVRASFERPYLEAGGTEFWTSASESRDDGLVLAWLQRQHLALQFTTDYDLSMAPPAVAPGLLILGRHTEYVAAPMFDWVEQHVNVAGDMNVLNFGANSFYWQVRLAPGSSPAAPLDVVSYKRLSMDPVAATDPALATVRWRDRPVDRPEGAVLGAQYVAVVAGGGTRFDLVVGPAVPRDLLVGTGWQTGTVLRGLLRGEADVAYPGSGGIAIMSGHAVTKAGAPLTTSVTIRVSPAGARVFDAGTFAWADGFDPTVTDIGVSPASFDQFNRNVLAWLGFPSRP